MNHTFSVSKAIQVDSGYAQLVCKTFGVARNEQNCYQEQ